MLHVHTNDRFVKHCYAGRELALAYRATEHGWSALQFHERCNMKGPCVIYAVTSSGARFGGFNSEGFRSSNDYSPSSKAFLFCWPQSEEDPVILRKARHVFTTDDCPFAPSASVANPTVLRLHIRLWAQPVFTT